jgi:hypothetical protein
MSMAARPAAHPVAITRSSGVTRSRAAAPISPPPTAVTSRPTVSTSHHSRLGPVAASNARRETKGATPVPT